MTVQDLHRVADPTHLLERLAGFAGGLRRRRSFKRLTDLDDHILEDIGLTRDDVETASRLPSGFDPFSEANRMRLDRARLDLWNRDR